MARGAKLAEAVAAARRRWEAGETPEAIAAALALPRPTVTRWVEAWERTRRATAAPSEPPRTCGHCGAALVLRPDESPQRFRHRRFCNSACRRAAEIARARTARGQSPARRGPERAPLKPSRDLHLPSAYAVGALAARQVAAQTGYAVAIRDWPDFVAGWRAAVAVLQGDEGRPVLVRGRQGAQEEA